MPYLVAFPGVFLSSRRLAQGIISDVTEELERRVKESGRTAPVPKMSERARMRMEMEAAKQAAIEEQNREEAALAALNPRKEDSHTVEGHQTAALHPLGNGETNGGGCADCGDSWAATASEEHTSTGLKATTAGEGDENPLKRKATEPQT